MQLHTFSVGLLTELAPDEHPNLLGLNEACVFKQSRRFTDNVRQNAGQSIRLRIRTDKYDGFRLYSEVSYLLVSHLYSMVIDHGRIPQIRRVALHELTHNVWGDHDENVSRRAHFDVLDLIANWDYVYPSLKSSTLNSIVKWHSLKQQLEKGRIPSWDLVQPTSRRQHP